MAKEGEKNEYLRMVPKDCTALFLVFFSRRYRIYDLLFRSVITLSLQIS